jgi:hypothetical protein
MPMSCGEGVGVGVGDGDGDGDGDGLPDGVGDGDGLIDGEGDGEGLVEGVGDGAMDGLGDALTRCRLSTASDPAHAALNAQKLASKISANARICGNRIDESPINRLVLEPAYTRISRGW